MRHFRAGPSPGSRRRVRGLHGPGIPRPRIRWVSRLPRQWSDRSGYSTLCPGPDRGDGRVLQQRLLGWVSADGEVAYLDLGSGARTGSGESSRRRWHPGSLATGCRGSTASRCSPRRTSVPVRSRGSSSRSRLDWRRAITASTSARSSRPRRGWRTTASFWLVTVLNPMDAAVQSGAVYSRSATANLSVPTRRHIQRAPHQGAPLGCGRTHAHREQQHCTSDCPAKPLAQYVAENSAYAGMNGNVSLPADYPACAAK